MIELTDRDLNILTDLYHHTLLSTKQIVAIHSDNETNLRRIQRRLQLLREAKYICPLNTPVDEANNYVIAQRGMNALTNSRHFPPKRVSIPRSTRSYRSHDLALSDFTVSLDLHVRSLKQARLLDELSLINRSPRLDVRSHRGWPVSFSCSGILFNHWVKPDRFMGIEFSDRPAKQNTRYFSIELDRGTMPLKSKNLEKASIFRKFLTYQSTHTDEVLREIFAIPHAYTLFLTTGPHRRDNMVELAQEAVTDESAAKTMLFAVHPPAPTVGKYTDLNDLDWINGMGEKMALPL